MNLRERIIALAVLLVAFAARLYALGDIPFWYDEGLVGWSARLPFLETARWTAADVHPPLYFWVVSVWRLAAGESEFALRFVSAVCGFLSVVAVYKLGARLQGPPLGALAALFLGLSRFHIWWSQELRMYILGSMFMLFSVWLTLRIVHGRPKRADWLAYILVSAAGLYSIYLVAFALAFEAVYVVGWLLVSSWMVEKLERQDTQTPGILNKASASIRSLLKNRLLWTWVGAQAVVLALFLPWFLYFLTQYRTWSDSTPFDFALFVQFYATLLAAGAPSNIDQWLVPVLVVWAVLLCGAFVGLRGRRDGAGQQHQRARGIEQRAAGRRGGWLIVLLLVLPPLTVYLGTSPRSFFYTPRVEARYLLPFIWSFSLVLAWCVWRIGRARRLPGIAAALVVVVLSGASLSQYYAARLPNDVYQSLAAALRAQKQPGDGVLLDDDRTWPIFEFYYAGGNKDWKGVPNGSKIREKEVNGFLSDYWEQHDALWLVWNEDALRIDENHALEKWLAARAVLTREVPFGNKRLIFYARTAERALSAGTAVSAAKPTYTLDQTLYPGLTLKGYDQAVRRYRAGDEIVLGTYWQSSREDIVAAALEGLTSGPRAQQSLTIPVGDSYALLRFPVTVDMPPAEYRVVVKAGLNPPMSIARAEIGAAGVETASPDVTIQTPREVRFQNGIRLMGYDANVTTLRPGDNMPLTLYWQASQPVAQRYKVFVHLLGALFNPKTNNPLWGQQDQEPLNGALPTTAWGLNRSVSDQYLIKLSPDAPPGRYIVEIGWYHATSGERLPVVGGDGAVAGDHVNLLEIDVQ